MPTAVLESDYIIAAGIMNTSGLTILSNRIAQAIAEERERCATVALEQRCERGTAWDKACVAIAAAIRATQ